MATIPTGTILAAQRCHHQLQQRQKTAVLRSESVGIGGSPVGSPDCTPPASPRKPESPLSAMNLLSKLSQLLHPRSMSQEGEIGGPPGSPRLGSSRSKFTQLFHNRSMSNESDVTSPPTSPGLEASHSNLSPVVHVREEEFGVSASGQTQSLEASNHTSSITSMT